MFYRLEKIMQKCAYISLKNGREKGNLLCLHRYESTLLRTVQKMHIQMGLEKQNLVYGYGCQSSVSGRFG